MDGMDSITESATCKKPSDNGNGVVNNMPTTSENVLAKEESNVKQKTIVASESAKKLTTKLGALAETITKDTNELLGSVTTFTPIMGAESGLTVRTSARVIQKMKLDSIRPSSPVPQEKREQMRDDRPGPKTPSQSKSNRNVWNNTEKNFFFEALNEYGKDFDSIAQYINAKSKRKNILDITLKTKEQIRLFYYQSHQKVNKYLKFSDDVKKLAQELYALINYGEMRKKVMFMTEKSFRKLRDLVYKGSVTLRIKGKNVKIKTPSCKALRQLNQLEEWQEDIKLPLRVEVLMKPVNVYTWGKVQNLAQNPRVKVTLPIQRRVSCLIKTLQRKWQDHDFRLIEKTMSMQSSNSLSKSAKSKTLVESEILKASTSTANQKELQIRVLPPVNVTIHRPMVNLKEFLSSHRLCLNAYEERIGVTVKGEALCSEQINALKEMKLNSKRQRHDSDNVKKSPDTKKGKVDFDIRPLEPCDKLEKILSDNANNLKKKSMDEEPARTDGYKCEKDVEPEETKFDNVIIKCLMDNEAGNASTNEMKTEDKTAKNIKSEEKNQKETKTEDTITTNKEEKPVVTKRKERSAMSRSKKELRKDSGMFRPLISAETIKKIREGWTLSNIGDMTFGDLYLMFGSDLQLNLEYLFIDTPENVEPIKTTSSLSSIEISSNISISNTNVIELKNVENKNIPNVEHNKQENILGNKLKQLLMIANLADQKKKKQSCICGHVCDRPSVITSRSKKNDDSPSSFVSSKTHYTSQSDNNVFRPPALPSRSNLPVIDPYKFNNNRLKYPKWLRNRSTFPTKQVVVQRILPLQPGMSSKYDPVNISSKATTTAERKETVIVAEKNSPTPMPKIQISINDTNISLKLESNVILPSCSNMGNDKKTNKTTEINNVSDTNDFAEIPELENSQNSFIRSLHENIGFKSLMEISLPSPMRMDCEESPYDALTPTTPSMSPMKLLRGELGDSQNCNSQWPSSDYNDFSFSSFLGHIDALTDNSRNDRLTSRNSDDCNIPDTSLSIINEPSVDFITKFAQIAEEFKEQGHLQTN